ncbi:glycosyltransferase family 4 protein [Leptolyngbya sp. 'hensonii']|uniref:glycosyltransferase family 4 protein n=1 Tax=Leptolyngbya sp. 'hensonii' TaxID=1922337 RepID=UPI000AEBDBDB|nr:glycosyltransferase family 4 protein [Leptolyngbya sp. 'hensonii']
MRICFIAANEYAPWGGSEELWFRSALRLAQQGFAVTVGVKAWKPEASQIAALEAANCQVVRRRSPTTLPQRLLSRLQRWQGHDPLLDDHRPDLAVISQGNNLDGWGWMEACQGRQIPYGVISQAAAENFWPPDDLAVKLAALYQAARKCFFVSQANLKLTLKQLAIDLPQAQVVANPFNVPFTTQLPWPQPKEPLQLACVARLDPVAKGQDLLFEVLRTQKWRDRPLQISLFGNGSNRQTLEQLQQLWQVDAIQFGGFVPDVVSIWKTHHALMLPSRYEGLPLSLVEAMLCGRPAIATDVAGIGELVEDNRTGFLAVAPTVACLDEALERAWQRRHDWYEMGQAAAVAVRRQIPADPVAVFVEELKSLL